MKMCDSCPFNPSSPWHHKRATWVGHLDAYGGTVPHGCHDKKDEYAVKDPELQCVGHRQYLKNKAAKEC